MLIEKQEKLGAATEKIAGDAVMDIPKIDQDLAKRIKLVRRDIGNLLFHFTRTPDDVSNQIDPKNRNALTVLRKILEEGKLLGSSKWISDISKCICFTEAPIQEFAALFSLVKIAANEKQRPRYEPYGIAAKFHKIVYTF